MSWGEALYLDDWKDATDMIAYGIIPKEEWVDSIRDRIEYAKRAAAADSLAALK